MKIIYSLKCLEYGEPGHPESPARVSETYNFIEDKFDFVEPKSCDEEDILRVHSQELMESVKNGDFFDPDTPRLPGIFGYVRLAAGAGMLAVKTAVQGESAFSLMRPPGHHAGKNTLGGFCYFNNIAIAIRYAQQKLGVKKVLILDIDCHHGNGTQDIFLSDQSVLFISLHQSPFYPGTGLCTEDNCHNYPLPAGTGEEEYLKVLQGAINETSSFKPDLIGVSVGFDTYKGDPLTNMQLEKESYNKIGKIINQLEAPTFIVLEGGYSEDMPVCVNKFLEGFLKE
jgi:acetoin utilization deacetylase AcuC-like enzyme